MTTPAEPAFTIHYSAQQAERLKALAAVAAAAGVREQFIADLRTIDRELRSRPLAWGDPWYRQTHLGLLICHGLCQLVHVYYGVDETRRAVYIKEFLPLPGGPLDRP
jgi:hypothetical protein